MATGALTFGGICGGNCPATPLFSLVPFLATMYTAEEKEGVKFSEYLHARGVQQWVEFQPAERFWTFQLVETTIFAGLAAALLAVVVWLFRRRVF